MKPPADCIGYAGDPAIEPYFVANVRLRDGTIRECRIAPTRPPPGRRAFVRGPAHPHPIVEVPVAPMRPKFDGADTRVCRYVCAIRDGAALPPIHAAFDGTGYEIRDGNHRAAAAKALGHSHILAYLQPKATS
jgi:hypothetical protein